MRALVFGIAVAVTAGLAADMALVQPADLAKQVASDSRPLVLQVGPNVLYRSKHIPRSIYAGPASRPEGLGLMKKALEKEPREREIIVYCGCCPWDHCPNIKPALALLKDMGFSHAKAMYMETSFAKDWIDKGYPVEPAAPKQ